MQTEVLGWHPPAQVSAECAPTVRLVNTGDIEARATAALSFAANVHPGQTVVVRDQGLEKRGRVRTVVPVGDERSRQFEVRVTLASQDWLVGAPIEVSLPSSALRTVLTVPRDALVIRQNHCYVLRVTGAGINDLIGVQGPLAAGDRPVIRGGERLAAGQPVWVIEVIEATHHGSTSSHAG